MRRAILAIAVLTALLPGATRAAEAVPIEILRQLADAIGFEESADDATRYKVQRTLLTQSIAELRDVQRALGSHAAATHVANAIKHDQEALSVAEPPGDDQYFDEQLEDALFEKDAAMAVLNAPQQPLTQCTDGRDNDRDGMGDARFDSGCSSTKDATERSPFKCSLETVPATGAVTVKGDCTGPFEELAIDAPPPARFDTMPVPRIPQAERCEYATPQRLECEMEDGMQNPKHAFSARLRFASSSPSTLRVRVRDFAGRVRAWTAKPAAGGRADLRATVKIDSAFLDRNGTGRVSGTIVLANLGPAAEARGARIWITSNRLDSEQGVKVEGLTCTPGGTGTLCPLPPLSRGVELAFAFGMPASGAGRFVVTVEIASGTTTDPQRANDKVSAETNLTSQP